MQQAVPKQLHGVSIQADWYGIQKISGVGGYNAASEGRRR